LFLQWGTVPVLARQTMSPDLSELKRKYIFSLTPAKAQQWTNYGGAADSVLHGCCATFGMETGPWCAV